MVTLHVAGSKTVLDMDPKKVFQGLRKEFSENVDLNYLLPFLDQAKLLTDSEYQELAGEWLSRDARVAKLIEVLQRRGPSCPTKVLQCLQAERSHPGHARLVKLLEEFLAGQPRKEVRTSPRGFMGTATVRTSPQHSGNSSSRESVNSAAENFRDNSLLTGKRPSGQLQPSGYSPAPKRKATMNRSPQGEIGFHERFSDTNTQEFMTQYLQQSTFEAHGEAYYGPDHGTTGLTVLGNISKTEQEFASILKTHAPVLMKWINLKSLLPYLIRHRLVTDDESEILQSPYYTREEKILKFLSSLMTKGPEAYERFLSSLEEEHEHSGHKSLSEALKGATSSTESEFGSILKTHAPVLMKWINLKSLLPYLIRHRLVTDDESETLQSPYYTREEKILKFLSSLMTKGPEAYERFLSSLEEEHEHSGHKSLSEALKGATSSTESDLQTPRSKFAKLLKDYYKLNNFFSMAAGPGRMEFVRLALVKKQKVNPAERERDPFLKSTLHGLVDDIANKKKSIDMYEIFEYGNHSRKLVLVEGAPGVGKTMLAMKLCVDWERGKILQEYDLVILVPLRSFHGESNVKVEDIVNFYLEGQLATQVTEDLVATGGEKVMLFLEGWDELSPELRKDFSFFFKMIMGNKLPNASIMVTSRSTVTTQLYDYMDERRIEVLGFDRPQITEFISINAPEKAEMVWNHFKKFPNLMALAHIPLTLAIICDVAGQTDQLPLTLTGLYDKYICNVLYQNLKKQPGVDSETIRGLELRNLPENASHAMKALGKIALRGFEEREFVFHRKHLCDAGLDPSESFDGYGLLSTDAKPLSAGCEVVYQFSHLSVQEFLAALQITQLSPISRIRLLQTYWNDKQFLNIWRFLSGITKLEDKELKSFLISHTTTKANREQLFLLNCLFEAHNPEICRTAAEKLCYTLDLNNLPLNATDCLSAVYTIAAAEGEWNLDLRGCNIGADGLEVFKEHLVGKVTPDHDFQIGKFNLRHNQLNEQAIRHLVEIIRAGVSVSELHVGSNKIGNAGVEHLADVLSTCQTVSQLYFFQCGFTCDGAEALARMLKHNHSLRVMVIEHEEIGDNGVMYIASSLAHNTTLTEISLSKLGLSDPGLQHLSEMLKVNTTLETLRISRNGLTARECKVLAEIIEHNKTLVAFNIAKNQIGDEGFSIIMDTLIARPHSALRRLCFHGCGITGRAAYKLVELFTVTQTFEIIQLSCNPLGDEGAEHIADALSLNASRSVKEIWLDKNTQMSERGEELLTKVSRERNVVVKFEHTSML